MTLVGGPRRIVRHWDADVRQWVQLPEKTNTDGRGWTLPTGYERTLARVSPFDPYIGAGTIWQRDVSTMPLHSNSAAQAQWMADHINYGSGFGGTGLNTSLAGTKPIQCYVVDSRQPGCNYQYITGSFGSGYEEFILKGWVPWPDWAFIPQPGQDSGLAIFDIGTGILREYYLVSRVAGYDNRWTCSTGGYSIAPRDLIDWPSINYATQLTEGSNAVVHMHNHLGWIDIAGTRRGELNHALAFTFANAAVVTSIGEAIRSDGTRYQAPGPCWPAKGGDGDIVPTADEIPIHGQWARLPADLDLSPTGPYPPFLRLVIKACQKYGLVGTDTNDFVHAFNAEPGYTEQHFFGTDPWRSDGDLYKKYAALNMAEGRDPNKPFDLGAFPWAQTQWAPRNWGKPD